MENKRLIWDVINEKHSLTELITFKNNRHECFIDGNTSSPSVQYDPHTEIATCHKCDKAYDFIGLYAVLNGYDRVTAIKEIAKQDGISFDKVDEKTIKKQEKIHEIYDFFADKCHDNFLSSKYHKSVKEKRGFTDETIKIFKVGLIDKIIQKELEKKYDVNLLQRAGFLSEKGNWIVGKRIVYPYLDFKEKPRYFIFRLLDDEKDFREDAKYVKLRHTKYSRELLFGINSLKKARDKPLVITEGITDSLSTIQIGYPCLSPVTVRFKKEDNEKILRYAKGFKKVIIINDTEENNAGLKGAEATLKFLLKNEINVYINEILKPVGVDKIDLDEYLKIDGENRLKELADSSIEGFEYLLSFIDKNSSQEQLEGVLILLTNINLVKREDLLKKIKSKKNIGMRQLRQIYEIVKEREKKEKKKQRVDELLSNEQEKDDLICKFEFKDGVVYNYKNGVHYVTITENGSKDQLVLELGLELIHKTRYLGTEFFSYKFNKVEYNTESRTMMLMRLKPFIYEGNLGNDIVKKLISYLANELQLHDAKNVLGFDDGWILPQHQDDKKYRIILHTDIQKKTYEKAKNNMKTLENDNFEEIYEKLKRFLKITEMDIEKTVIIIGWSIAAVFRLAILRHFNYFPGLMCIGDNQTGKTYVVKFFALDFYRIWDNYFSGDSIKEPSRIEDILSSSTFPIHIDELEYVKYSVIGILKSTLTGVHDYIRKKNVLETIQKPEVAPFVVTTNRAPKPFMDPALNSKMILLNYKSNEKITEKQEWLDLYKNLKDVKLFTYLYDFTKNWDDKKIANLLKIIQNKCPISKDHSRLRKKYIIILFGLILFEKLFNIDLTSYLNLELFHYSERLISKDLLGAFIEFCNMAIEYDVGSTSTSGVHLRGDNKKFITSLLKLNKKGDYIFTHVNLRDFNEFMHEKYSLKQLGDLLNDAIEDKEIIKQGSHRLEGKVVNGIRIDGDFNDKIKL